MSKEDHASLATCKWYQVFTSWICFRISSRQMEVKCEDTPVFVKLVLICAFAGREIAAWTCAGTLAV